MILTCWKLVEPDDYQDYFVDEPHFVQDKVIDDALSVVWVERFYTPGEFTMTVRATTENLAYFSGNYLIITRKETDRAMIPEKIELESNAKRGDLLRISGYSLEHLPWQRDISQRSTITADSFSDSAYAVGYYMQENIGSHWYYNSDNEHPINDTGRYKYINYLVHEQGVGTNQKLEIQPFGQNLGQLISQVCVSAGTGYRIRFDKKTALMYYCMIGKTDKTKEIIFSKEFQNLANTTFTIDNSTYYTDIMIAGEGEGNERIVRYAETPLREKMFGFKMRQKFVNGGNISKKTTGVNGTTVDYNSLLYSTAYKTLRDSAKSMNFDGDVIQGGQFKYRTDYSLGDIVTLKNDYGVRATATITEVVEHEDRNGYIVTPKFEIETLEFKKAEKIPPIVTEHYGIRWRKTPSSSPTIEYLYDAENFTPVTMTNDGVSLGDWANAFFVRNNYPVMCRFDGTEDYRLDPLDHTKKLDGTASDVTNESYAGNAMSCFDCHIWMKFWEDEDDDGWNYVEVSNRKLDVNFVDYPYIRATGTHAEKLYYPMFEGRIIDGKLRSVGTGSATVYNTAAQFETAAKSNGSNWMIGDWHHNMWMLWLHTMMAKSFHFYTAFGLQNALHPNGSCLTRGQFYGSSSYNSIPVKTFFCENLWGNHYHFMLGAVVANPESGEADYYIKQAPPYTTDGTHDDYIYCGKGKWGTVGITALKATPMGFIQSEGGGSYSGWARQWCDSGGGAIGVNGFRNGLYSYGCRPWSMNWTLSTTSNSEACCSVYLRQPEVI